jgi:hypothetical protein
VANTTFYERGNAYHDSAGNPAIIKNGNELTFTDNFNAGGGGDPYTPPAYSTEEHVTGRKWIDGKDIYEKVVILDDAVTVSTNWSNLGISNADYDVMIHANGLHADGSFYPLILDLHNSAQATTLFAKASASIDVKTLVLEYTKPTAPTLTTTRTSKKKG